MSDEQPGTSTAAESAQGQEAAPTTTAPEQGGGGNPAWAELRSSLGDTMFKLAEPHLTKFDQSANQRITTLNEQLKGYSELGDAQTLQQYRSLAQRIDADPVAFYNQFQELLTQRGLLEAQQAAAENDLADEDDETDPRIAQLQQEQERIQEMLQAQELERLTAQQTNILQAQLRQVREANQWMSDADQQRVTSLAHGFVASGAAQTIEQAITRATAEYTEIRNGFLSTPRPGDSAPKLNPIGGGNPSTSIPQNLSKASRGETVDLVTAYLKSAASGQ